MIPRTRLRLGMESNTVQPCELCFEGQRNGDRAVLCKQHEGEGEGRKKTKRREISTG